MDGHTFTIPLQRISDEIMAKAGLELYVLRTDQNHPHISGNKLFKLHYNLQEAAAQNKKTILTFGGAYSNHIAATAAAGKEFGFHTIGIIRGDQPEELNSTLAFAKQQGMEIHYVSRELYRQKNDPAFIDFLKKLPGINLDDCYIIPEGGANLLGIKGCSEIAKHIPVAFNRICCACGTGTTLAGIVLSLKEGQQALGFQVLKGEGYMKNEVQHWLQECGSGQKNWSINEDYHFGGYARKTPELLAFMQDFEITHQIPLDFIYTAKMMYGIYDLMKKGMFQKGEIVVAVHTGGLQGNGIV